MTTEQIQHFIDSKKVGKHTVTISFKTRQPITGVFTPQKDYEELKEKNLWRVVTGSKLEEWLKNGDTGLIKIFSGSEITKLSMLN